jgi:hypothetical protein
MDRLVYVFIGLLFISSLLISGLYIFLWGDEELNTIKMVVANAGLIIVIELTCMLVIMGGIFLYENFFTSYDQ